MKYLAAFLLVLLPTIAFAAWKFPTYGGIAEDISSADLAAATSNITIADGPNGAIVCGDTGNDTITKLTANGQLFKRVTRMTSIGSAGPLAMWVATTGSMTGTVAIGATGWVGNVFTCVSYKGVDQTNPIDAATSSSATGVNFTQSLTPSREGEWAVMTYRTNGGFALNSQTNVTARSTNDPCATTGLNACHMSDSNGRTLSRGTTFTATVGSAGSQNYEEIMILLNPASNGVMPFFEF